MPFNPFAPKIDPDEISVSIGGTTFRGWSDLEVTLGLDRHSTAGFVAPFDSERPEVRQTFRPFEFPDLDITIGGKPLFSGTLVDVVPRVDANSKTITVSAYSKPAVLEDSTAPASLVPLESNNLGLRQIATRLASAFGLGVVFEADEGARFSRVAPDTSDRVQTFLTKLAQQRGLVISSTPDGELLFRRATTTGSPVVKLEQGKAPLMSVTPTFDPQSYYSEITGYASAKRGRAGSKHTEQNTRLAGGALRAMAFALDDTEKADAPDAVKAKLGRMFGNMVSYVAEVPTWRDPKGGLWEPNTTLTVKAPDAMIYRETELLIRDVVLRQSATSRTASLGLVLPSAFSGEIPSRLPWDE